GKAARGARRSGREVEGLTRSDDGRALAHELDDEGARTPRQRGAALSPDPARRLESPCAPPGPAHGVPQVERRARAPDLRSDGGRGLDGLSANARGARPARPYA